MRISNIIVILTVVFVFIRFITFLQNPINNSDSINNTENQEPFSYANICIQDKKQGLYKYVDGVDNTYHKKENNDLIKLIKGIKMEFSKQIGQYDEIF